MTRPCSDLRPDPPASYAETPTVGSSRGGPEEAPERVIGRGACLGRYVVLYALGAGGMGKVYAAYDPELDRKVALKVLRGDLRRTHGSEAERRLLREAQAIARLAHPNVVTVYDVGAVGDRLFIAMELIEGVTVEGWLAAGPRPFRDVLRVFVEAGRGLAAAHEVGLVHRDFKPRNVMVSDDGRVRILDFGLVRAIADGAPAEGGRASAPRAAKAGGGAGPSGDRLAVTLTRTGGRLGTPAYMAPEQAAGHRGDHRSDQFSFCVSLYQALHGELPAVAGAGDPRDRKASRAHLAAAVPGWLRRPLARGLAIDPGERFPSMARLLAEIEREPARKRRRWSLAALAALVAGALAGAALLRPEKAPLLCQGAERKLQGIWDGAARAQSRRAFEDTGGVRADESWSRAAALLDDYAGAWTAAHREACEATHLRGEQSEEILDLQMACLDGRLRELRAASDLLRDADDQIVARAVEIADGLTGLAACGDRRRLAAGPAPPADPAVAVRADGIRMLIAESRVRESASQYQQALEIAEAAHLAAAALGDPPLIAEALHRLASSEGRMGRLEEMKDRMVRAIRAGQAAGHDEVVAQAMTDLVVSAVVRGKADEAHLWAELASGAVERLGPGGELASRLRVFLGMLADLEGRWAEAIDHYRTALEIDPEISARDRWRTLNNLGVAYAELERTAEAIASFRAALEVMEEAHGPRVPTLMAPLYNLGDLYLDVGDFAAALPLFERALAISDQAGLPDLLEVPVNLKGLGEALVGLGRPAEAIAPLERAIELDEARPQNRVYAALARFHLARALVMTGGDRELARDHARAARETLLVAGERWAGDLRDVELWLAAYGWRA